MLCFFPSFFLFWSWFSCHVKQTERPVCHPGGGKHWGKEKERKGEEEGERQGKEEESMPEEVQGFLHSRHLPVREGRPLPILCVSMSSTSIFHHCRATELLTSHSPTLSLSCLQVPPELLWWKVSVFHAAPGEAPGGLQPDHSTGRGGGGAVIRLPRHHRPPAVAQVRRRLADSPHKHATVHTQIKGFTWGLADTCQRQDAANSLNKLLFFCLLQVSQAGSVWCREWREGQTRVSVQPLKRQREVSGEEQGHNHIHWQTSLFFFLLCCLDEIRFCSWPLFSFRVRQRCGNSTSK